MQDSIGGNAKTVIIANVSPSEVFVQETVSTLNFAARARKIINKVILMLFTELGASPPACLNSFFCNECVVQILAPDLLQYQGSAVKGSYQLAHMCRICDMCKCDGWKMTRAGRTLDIKLTLVLYYHM